MNLSRNMFALWGASAEEGWEATATDTREPTEPLKHCSQYSLQNFFLFFIKKLKLKCATNGFNFSLKSFGFFYYIFFSLNLFLIDLFFHYIYERELYEMLMFMKEDYVYERFISVGECLRLPTQNSYN